MLFDVDRGERRVHGAGASRDLLVDNLHVLVETVLGKTAGRDVAVGVVVTPDELHFVFVFLLHLLAASGELFDDHFHLDWIALFVVTQIDRHWELASFLFLGSQRHGILLQRFLVVTVLVTPADVLVRRHVEVLLDVVERVLGDVRHAGVRVLPHRAFLRNNLAREKLDHGGLAHTVRTDTRDARCQRHLHGDILYRRLLVHRVRVRAVGHLHQRLTLGLDAVDETRLGESHDETSRALEFKEGLSLGVLFDELRQVTRELLQL
mmetsp:Transcript_5813/g.21044  ORF Transcript_5813/g.21044 Transcript_5813/m.21044 type:complete len:264 (-) Transcript_5813:2017-2808(-)